MKLLKTSLIYLVSILLQGGAVFLLLPVYTAYLSTTEYGTVAVLVSLAGFLSMAGFLSTFYLLSLHAAAIRLYVEYKADSEKTKELFSTLFLFVFGFGAVLTTLLWIFRKTLLEPFLQGIDPFPHILLGLLAAFFSSFFLLHQAILQAKQEARRYGIVNVVYVCLTTLCILLFVTVFHLKTTGVLLGLVVASFVFFLYVLWDIYLKSRVRFNVALLRESLLYSLPLLPHALFSWGMVAINKVLLNNLKNTATVGIYDIGFNFANIINVITWAINQAYVPWFFEKMKEKKATSQTFISFAENAVLFYGFGALILSYFVKDILQFFVTEQFREAWRIVPFMSFAYVFNGIYLFFVNPLFYNKRAVKYIPLCTLGSAAINILLNVLLIPAYGMMGSAIASLLALIISSLLVFVVSRRVEYIAFRWKQMYLYSFSFLLLSLFVFAGSYFTPLTFLLLRIVIVTLVTLALYHLKKSELRLFVDLILRKTKRSSVPSNI